MDPQKKFGVHKAEINDNVPAPILQIIVVLLPPCRRFSN